jgi:ligand-binding sensor domain-containing protein
VNVALRRALAILAAVAVCVLPAREARAETPLEVHTAIDDVRACAFGGEGDVLSGTTGGLAVVGRDGQTQQLLTALDGLPGTRVLSLRKEGKTVWIGTERGLVNAHFENGRVSITTSYPSPPVRAIHRHGDALYLATWGGGVMRLPAGGARLERVPFAEERGGDQGRVTALASFGGALVAGSAGAGLFRLDSKGNGELVALSGSRVPRTIWALAVDDARLWIGALEGAVSLGTDGEAREELDYDTRAFASTGGALFAGTYGRGVVRLKTSPTTSEHGGATWIQALDVSADGRLCTGTSAGLFVANTRVPIEGPPDNDVTAIARDGDRLWIGTYDRGVVVLEGGRFRQEPRVDGRVNALAIEPLAQGRRAWIATARGLTSIDDEGVRTFGGGGQLPSSAVHAVTVLSSGGALVGTERGAALIKDGAVSRIDDKQGVPIRAVWSVAEAPGGVLLLGSSSGLYTGRLGGPWQRACIASGHLRDDWVTALVVRGNDVYVGTYNAGVTRLRLEGDHVSLAEHLGGGYVNPAGLTIAGETLYAATMAGLIARPLSGGDWRALPRASTGNDVTGVVATGSDLWVASRRGLVRVRP